MAITLQALNDAPGESLGLSCKITSPVVRIPTSPEEKEFCLCVFDCDFLEKVFFYEQDPSNMYKNDKTAILFELVDPSGTYEIVLNLPDGQTVTLSNDDYGTFFDKGFNETQPLKIGYLIDWLKVFQQTGLKGIYSYTVNVENFSTPVSIESGQFLLYEFNEEDADETVKIETINNGVILNGEDYRGMEWYKSIRLRGKINTYTPDLEKLKTLDTNDRPVQVKDQINKSYQLMLYPDKSDKLIPFIENDLLSRDVRISSYDHFSFIDYNRLEVDPESIEIGDDYEGTSRRWFTVTFSDKKPLVKINLP